MNETSGDVFHADSRRLLEQTAAGDEHALGELVQRHLPGLRGFIRLRMDRALRDKESCSDIAQSVCVELLRRQNGFEYRGEAAFKAWLYSAALLKIKQHLRYHTAERRSLYRESTPAKDAEARMLLDCYASFHTPSRHAAAREHLGQVEAAFEQMPEEYREVIALSRIAGLSHAEIARQMGRSEGALRMLLHRALARLSTLLRRAGQ